MDNNIHNYRNKGLPAPAEPEVSDILNLEINRLRTLYAHVHDENFDDAHDDQRASVWIESQAPSEALYASLRELEKVYDIHQIVSILIAVVPLNHIGLRVVSVKQKLVLQFTRQAD
jgi:hypothetical protein